MPPGLVRESGHALGQKDHEADRWVAATAMWLGVPVVAHDAVLANVEGLNLLTNSTCSQDHRAISGGPWGSDAATQGQVPSQVTADSGTDRCTSQADSAGSDPVTRSIRNPRTSKD